MRQFIEKYFTSKLSIVIGVAIMLIAVGGFTYSVITNGQQARCVKNWANARSDRDEKVIAYNKIVSEAQVKYINKQQAVFTATNTQPFDVAAFRRALLDELDAYHAYKDALAEQALAQKNNPLPPAPKFTC